MLRLTEGSSLKGTVFNLANTMIGSGVLGLPFAIQQCGILSGVVLLLLVAICSDLTGWMLLYCVDATQQGSYAMVAEVLLGHRFGILVDVVVFMNIIGTCSSYIVIVGDLIPPFMTLINAPALLQDRTSLLLTAALCILLPLSSLRSLGALRYISLACLATIFALVCILVSMAVGVIPVSRPTDPAPRLGTYDAATFLGQLPVFLFAFNCHMNVPILYRELRRQTFHEIDSKFASKRNKMMLGLHVSFFIVFLVYSVAASAGYLAFRDRTAHDILRNFEPQIFFLASYVKFFYSMTIVCSYPIMCFSGASSFHRLLWQAAGCFGDCTESPRIAARRSIMFRFMRFGSKYPDQLSSPPPSPGLLSSPPMSPVYAPLNSAWSDTGETEDMGTTGSSVEFDLTYLGRQISLNSKSGKASQACRDNLDASLLLQPKGSYRLSSYEPTSELTAAEKLRTEMPAPSQLSHFVEVCVIISITLTVGIVLPDVSVVFGFTGSITCSLLMFGFPGLFYLKVKAKEIDHSGSVCSFGQVLGHAFAWAGLLISIVSTVLIASQT